VTPRRTRAMPNILPFGASNEEARPGCSPNGGTPGFPYDLLLIGVLDLALRNLFERHRQVVLRTRLDERGQELVERAFAELVVVVVDLPGALRGHDHERVARVHVVQQFVDAGMDHGSRMVPAAEAPLAVPLQRPFGFCPYGRLNPGVGPINRLELQAREAAISLRTMPSSSSIARSSWSLTIV